MTKNYIAAAVLAFSLSGASVHAAEASVDLGVHVQQVIAEIHSGNVDWQQMVGRIDRLVAHIDEQLLDGTGDYDELSVSRERLARARAQIQQQYLTTAQGEQLVSGPAPAAACEVCGAVHSAPAAVPAPPAFGTAQTMVDGGFSSVGSAGASTGGIVGGGGGGGIAGGGGIGGFGRLGVLGSVAAAIALAVDDDNDNPGLPASPSN